MGERTACEQNERISEWMSLALDGRLGIDDERRMQLHLSACSTCQAQWKAMQRLSVLFSDSTIVGPSVGFAVRVERRLAERAERRRRLFGGVAVLSSSLSLAGITVAVVTLVVVGLLAWSRIDDLPTVQQGSAVVSQVASGVGLMGKGVSLFLGDLLRQYAVPLLLLLGTGVAFLVALWVWLLSKRQDRAHRNGYV